jgi:hypothetical protein
MVDASGRTPLDAARAINNRALIDLLVGWSLHPKSECDTRVHAAHVPRLRHVASGANAIDNKTA